MPELNDRKNFQGVIFIFLYCLIGSLTYNLVSDFEQGFDPIKLLFYNFLFSAVFFNAFSISRIKRFIEKLKQYKYLVLKINLATAGAWMTTFYALKYEQPAIIVAIIFGFIPGFNLLMTMKKDGVNSVPTSDKIFAGLISSIVVAIICYAIMQSLPMSLSQQVEVILAITFAIIAVISTILCMVYMKALSTAGFSANQVMAMRFFIIILISSIFVINSSIAFSITFVEFSKILFIAALSVIIPLFLFQKGVERTTPITISFIMPLQPIFTYLIQMSSLCHQLSLTLFILIMMLTVLILMSAIFKSHATYRADRSIRP
jgi:drug/metabolite transporter (DMT)-like permease